MNAHTDTREIVSRFLKSIVKTGPQCAIAQAEGVSKQSLLFFLANIEYRFLTKAGVSPCLWSAEKGEEAKKSFIELKIETHRIETGD